MEMPLNRKVTSLDKVMACSDLCDALDIEYRYWLDCEYRSALFELMVEHDIFPSRIEDNTYVRIRWGRLTGDARIVPIEEHDSKSDAVAFALVLAIATKLEMEKLAGRQCNQSE